MNLTAQEKERRNTMILGTVFTVLTAIMLILMMLVLRNLIIPTDQPDVQYAQIPELVGMNIAEAKQKLDELGISYRIVPGLTKTPNVVEKIEYAGKTEDGKILVELGTRIKLYANEVDASKIIYLTFDDGPIVNYDNSMQVTNTTGKLLEILDKHKVKASFFLVGYQMIKEDRSKFVNDIYDGGHLIACHTFSHDLNDIYSHPSAFMDDVHLFEEKLENILGKEKYDSIPKCIRFPGGSSTNGRLTKAKALEYIAEARADGYRVYDWTALTNDADNRYRLDGESDKDYFIRSMMSGIESSAKSGKPIILLMHDKKATTDCLDELLEYLIDKGYYFDTLVNCPEYTFAEN